MNLAKYGFTRVAAAVPRVLVADTEHNANEIAALVNRGAARDCIDVMVFPELSLTGYTCADLFHQKELLDGAVNALKKLLCDTADADMLYAIGMPVETDNQLFNCAVVLHKGRILGVVPKTYLPNYNEFYEKRWFASSASRISDTVKLLGFDVPFGENLLFRCTNSQLCIGIEICEDLWVPIPPSSNHALHGANLLLNLSASNETVTKSDYRRELVKQQSARCYAAYVFCSAGQGESTTDVVFSGHTIIAENNAIVRETSYPEESSYVYWDADIQKLMNERLKVNSYLSKPNALCYRTVEFSLDSDRDVNPCFAVNPHPFVPHEKDKKYARCREIFTMQSVGLAERMRKTGITKAVIGLSGGLDSTLALLVSVNALNSLSLPSANVIGVTMPGFGTTGRTYQNALTLMRKLKIKSLEIPIKDACLQHFKDIGQDAAVHDITYENAQARERTQILMDIANKEGGLVVGTGDLSELALGWSTYNGDHMSHYGVNAGVPKTLVKHLIAWYADTAGNPNVTAVLNDILDTPISPELLPTDKQGNITQKTEDVVGPYELHDFFLYNMVHNGFGVKKILKLAIMAFEGKYQPEYILKWLKTFCRRFFAQQFKRSCMPDGVKIGSVCLSPRGDWRMPSDASAALYMQNLREAQAELEAGTL